MAFFRGSKAVGKALQSVRHELAMHLTGFGDISPWVTVLKEGVFM